MSTRDYGKISIAMMCVLAFGLLGLGRRPPRVASEGKMELSGKKIAILVDNGYEVREFWYPFLRMKEAGADVIVVGGKGMKVAESKRGLRVRIQATADTLRSSDFDALIIPGGKAPARLRERPEVVRFVKEAYNTGAVIAAICHGPQVMVAAGLLQGKTVTCTKGVIDEVRKAGATYVDKEIVRDGQIITSRGPKDLPVFSREILAAIK